MIEAHSSVFCRLLISTDSPYNKRKIGIGEVSNGILSESHLNQYDVIYLNMQHFLIGAKNQSKTEYLEQMVSKNLHKEYGELLNHSDFNLTDALREFYAETGAEFVFRIDEWDCVMRERQESEKQQKRYLNFLRDLLKNQPYVALAYVTGILPVKKFGQHLALNMLYEYSMINQKALEKYTGFTEDEVKALCMRFDMDLTGFAPISCGCWAAVM